MDILIIGGVDYSDLIASKGYGWSRNDLDSDKTTRTKDGKMRRDKITTKRKLTFNLHPATRERLAALDDALSAATFSTTYLDLHGRRTGTFYCSSFECELEEATDTNEVWGNAKFSVIEV